MEELKATLRVAMANHFVAYFKAHTYHWNTEGIEFPQYHEFFVDLYADYYAQVDTIAEYLRALDEYAPPSLMQLYDYKTINEDSSKPANLNAMLTNIGGTNDQLIQTLNKLFEISTAANEQGIANYAAGKLDDYKKHAWMIRSSLKSGK